MSTECQVRRNVQETIDDKLCFDYLIETGGQVFPDGRCIEVVKNDSGCLVLLDSKDGKRHQRIKIDGKIYVPPAIHPSALAALIIPTKRGDCGSTRELFSMIVDFFLDFGISKEAAQTTAYFIFASWFPGQFSVAPNLIVTATEAEGRAFLQLVRCFVRHALSIGEISMAIFSWVPMHLEPTILIAHLPPSMLKIFSISNHPSAFHPDKNGFTDFYSLKAIYAGPTLGGISGDALLKINCAFSGDRLPPINGHTLEKIADRFQAKLLDYRLNHVMQVRSSTFDVKTLPMPLRILARALGSCIVDAPDLQDDIGRLLETRGEELREERQLDPTYIAIEALFAHCHGENGDTCLRVNEIAAMATGILADRGEDMEFEPKKMGGQLRLLGFRPERDSKGFAIQLTVNTRRRIHRLARDYQVIDSDSIVLGCPLCVEAEYTESRGLNP